MKSCMSKSCKNLSVHRGLCKSHYNYVGLMVRQGKTSWAYLESAGLAVPLSRPARAKAWEQPAGWVPPVGAEKPTPAVLVRVTKALTQVARRAARKGGKETVTKKAS